jgi:hypothetical protein
LSHPEKHKCVVRGAEYVVEMQVLNTKTAFTKLVSSNKSVSPWCKATHSALRFSG